jgi:hypothetical protein
MIFSVVRHRRNSTAYAQILSQLKCLPEEPNGLTEVRIKVPAGRYYTAAQIAKIEEHLLPLVAEQECLQFGKLTKLRSFWHKDGSLSGLGAIHLFAHLLLGHIARNRSLIIDRNCTVIRERIYRPNPSQLSYVSIVFTANLRIKSMRFRTRDAWLEFEKLLELGSLEPPDTKEVSEPLVAAG